MCFLPAPTELAAIVAAIVVRGFVPLPLHLEVAKFALEVDLTLHPVRSQQ